MFRPTSFDQFRSTCDTYGSQLDPNLLAGINQSKAGQTASKGKNSLRDPYGMLTAIRITARQIQRNKTVLAGQPVDTQLFPEDRLAVLLAKLLNAGSGLEPKNSTALAPRLPLAVPGRVGSCGTWEPTFAKLARRFAAEPGRAENGQAIVDPQGQVVALRANDREGDCAALTLMTLEVETELPAGSLVNINVGGDQYVSGRPAVTAASPRVVMVSDIVDAGLMRPSAYALPAGQRLAHWGPEHLTTASLNIGRIVTLAQSGLERL